MTISALTIATLDTETVGLEGHVYDIGYVIHNKRGEIALERNWLVEENFTNPKKMMGAFYAGKHFTHYARMLQDGEIRLTPWAEIVGNASGFSHAWRDVVAVTTRVSTRVLVDSADPRRGRILQSPVKILDIGNLLRDQTEPKGIRQYCRSG